MLPLEMKSGNLISDSLQFIHPSKIDDIKAILQVIPDTLDELWLFGSTITKNCKDTSDIDICLVGNTTHEEEKRIYMAPKCAVDIIKETPEGFMAEQKYRGSIYRQVRDTGVLLYRKGANVNHG